MVLSNLQDILYVVSASPLRCTLLHREDESFDLLGLSSLKTSCGVAKSAIYVAWPAEYFIPRYEILLINVPEEQLVGPSC